MFYNIFRYDNYKTLLLDFINQIMYNEVNATSVYVKDTFFQKNTDMNYSNKNVSQKLTSQKIQNRLTLKL